MSSNDDRRRARETIAILMGVAGGHFPVLPPPRSVTRQEFHITCRRYGILDADTCEALWYAAIDHLRFSEEMRLQETILQELTGDPDLRLVAEDGESIRDPQDGWAIQFILRQIDSLGNNPA